MAKRTNVLDKEVYVVEYNFKDGATRGEYVKGGITGNHLLRIQHDDPVDEKVITLVHELAHYIVAESRRIFTNLNIPKHHELEENLADKASSIFINSVVKIPWVKEGVKNLKGEKDDRKK